MRASIASLWGPHALIFYAFAVDARRILAWAITAHGATPLEILARLDFLNLIEWLFIFILAARCDFSAIRMSRFERIATAMATIFATLFVDPITHVHIAPCIWLAARFARSRRLWPLCVCLALVSLQRVPAALAPSTLHQVSIGIDVWATHHLLRLFGYANALSGSTLHLAQSAIAVNVADGCDTLTQLPRVVAAFVLFEISRGRRLDRLSALGLGVVLALIFPVNWFRLGAMTPSYADYDYWHSGEGASLISAVYALAPFVMSDVLVKWRAAPAGRR